MIVYLTDIYNLLGLHEDIECFFDFKVYQAPKGKRKIISSDENFEPQYPT